MHCPDCFREDIVYGRPKRVSSSTRVGYRIELSSVAGLQRRGSLDGEPKEGPNR